jgi:hypothetical protein
MYLTIIHPHLNSSEHIMEKCLVFNWNQTHQQESHIFV